MLDMTSMENFFSTLLEAATAQEAIDFGLFSIAREISALELMELTGESTLRSDARLGITWGMVNTNNIKGIVYCRHATGLSDPHHRKHGADFSIV